MKQIKTLDDLLIDHPYYSSDNNYYSNDCFQHYATWPQFYKEYADADIDMNYCFRHDLFKDENGNYTLKMFFIAQRKGIYIPITVENIQECNLEQIVDFLKKHWEYSKLLWQPFSNLES